METVREESGSTDISMAGRKAHLLCVSSRQQLRMAQPNEGPMFLSTQNPELNGNVVINVTVHFSLGDPLTQRPEPDIGSYLPGPRGLRISAHSPLTCTDSSNFFQGVRLNPGHLLSHHDNIS